MTTTTTTTKRRTFDELVLEELPIQAASIAMEGGIPSCMTLFDNYLICYSLKSQGKAIYRTGKPRDCTAKLSDFKFCMSLKSLDEERKEEVWIRRRAEWWAGRRMGRSSEEVWDAKKNVYPIPAPEEKVKSS